MPAALLRKFYNTWQNQVYKLYTVYVSCACSVPNADILVDRLQMGGVTRRPFHSNEPSILTPSG